MLTKPPADNKKVLHKNQNVAGQVRSNEVTTGLPSNQRLLTRTQSTFLAFRCHVFPANSAGLFEGGYYEV